MNIRTTLTTSTLLAACIAAGSAHAALQGRDLDGNFATFEAYYDTVLDITWLANANLGAGSSYDDGSRTNDGRMTWDSANAWAANLSFTDGVNVYDNWRLPTIEPANGVTLNDNFSYDGSTDLGFNITSSRSELAYMFHINLGNTSNFTPAGATIGCNSAVVNIGTVVGTCLQNTGPFSNLQSWGYWYGVEYAQDTRSAWGFVMFNGWQNPGVKDSQSRFDNYAWAVSPGDVAAVPEVQTYALMLAGLGLIVWRARRRG